MSITNQLLWLFILAIPIACVAWTVTHEEVFREPREYCIRCSKEGSSMLTRKFFYLFTCEYCFSHYVTILFVALTDFRLLIEDWRGYLIAGFALVWIANVYMSLFARVRIDLKRERTEVNVLEKQQQLVTSDPTRTETQERQKDDNIASTGEPISVPAKRRRHVEAGRENSDVEPREFSKRTW